MIDDVAKAHLHDKLRGVRDSLVWKLEGLAGDDIRRPMTPTGTNLPPLDIARSWSPMPPAAAATSPTTRR